jgi:hypothetical protein
LDFDSDPADEIIAATKSLSGPALNFSPCLNLRINLPLVT